MLERTAIAIRRALTNLIRSCTGTIAAYSLIKNVQTKLALWCLNKKLNIVVTLSGFSFKLNKKLNVVVTLSVFYSIWIKKHNIFVTLSFSPNWIKSFRFCSKCEGEKKDILQFNQNVFLFSPAENAQFLCIRFAVKRGGGTGKKHCKKLSKKLVKVVS